MYYCLLLFTVFTSVCHAADLECPDQFRIEQDAQLRMFRVLDNLDCVGFALNSDYGEIDFYNSRREKEWINLYDCLCDASGNCIGHITFEWRSKGLFQKSSPLIKLFSAEDELLAILEEGENGKSFVFRDPETGKALAAALWSWLPTGAYETPVLKYYIQEWEVLIVDRHKLQQKKIPNIYLVWVLLKYSQLHFPDPNRILYIDKLPCH